MATAPIPIGPAPVVPDASKAEADFDADYEERMRWEGDVMVPGINALAINVYNNALAAAEDAATAQEAAGQAGLYATSAAQNAQIVVGASEDLRLYLGAHADDPISGRNGEPLQIGHWYQQIGGFIRAYNGSAWGNGLSAIAGVTSVNGQSGPVTVPIITHVSYDDRASLRAGAGTGYALVSSLGLFAWVAGSDEPDDDESCFATSTGRWLLEAAHWDLIDSWQTPDREAATDDIEDIQARWPGKVLHGSGINSITSITALSTASFTATVSGAQAGAKAIATPPGQIDSRIAFYALATAQDTVTVYLSNASAGAATLTAATWTLTVFNP